MSFLWTTQNSLFKKNSSLVLQTIDIRKWYRATHFREHFLAFDSSQKEKGKGGGGDANGGEDDDE